MAPHSSTAFLGKVRSSEAILAAVAFGIAMYLTACQLGRISPPWEPWFPATAAGYLSGSDQVLHWPALKFLPIPDAALGAVAYLLRLLLTLTGGRDRTAHTPWVPLASGLLSAGLLLVAVGLILAQWLLVGAWCTLCLASAACSLGLFLLSLPESVEAVSQVRRQMQSGRGLLSALAQG